jgi:hypothetical protein
VTRPVLAALGIGLALGLLSMVGDWLPLELRLAIGLANAGGPWLAGAFAAGAVGARVGVGAATGAGALLVAVLTYYGVYRLVVGDVVADPLRAITIWGAAALVIGASFGAAGAAWAGGSGRAHLLGASVLSGGFLAEAILRGVEVEIWTGIDLGRTSVLVAAAEFAIAVVLPLVLLERRGWAAAGGLTVGIGVAGWLLAALAIEVVRALISATAR